MIVSCHGCLRKKWNSLLRSTIILQLLEARHSLVGGEHNGNIIMNHTLCGSYAISAVWISAMSQ